jgi:hypothetical protein
MRRLVALFLLASVSLASPAAAQQLDVIRGRITGPDSQPVQRATVKATSYSGQVSKTTTSDRNGRWSITYPNGEGDYWIDIRALGFQPKRFEIKRVADEEVLIADTRLQSSIATLDQVNVTASGPRALPNRNAANPNVGGGERQLNNAMVSPTRWATSRRSRPPPRASSSSRGSTVPPTSSPPSVSPQTRTAPP